MNAANRPDSPNASGAPIDAALDRIVVQLSTWGASVLFLVTLGSYLVSRDLADLGGISLPIAVAGSGWFMLLRDQPRPVPQLIIAMAALVAVVLTAPESIPGDPLLGLLSMSIFGTILTRRRVLPFAAVAAASIGVTSIALESPGTTDTDQALGAMVAVITYGVTAGMFVWLRRRSEESRRQLQALMETKDQFVATVSHELRTPLTTILGLAHEMRDRYEHFSRDEIDDFIEMLVREGTDVADIVEDLLVAARAEIGTLALKRSPVELQRELTAALTDAAVVVLDMSALPDGATVDIDSLRFRQIVRNLLVNASHYGGDDVRVIAHHDRGTVFVEVRDDGPAIPLEDRELMFEAYQRSSHHDITPGSTGLGLTVSRRLARLMDGNVSYRHDGRDSVFTLTLPLMAPASPLAAAS